MNLGPVCWRGRLFPSLNRAPPSTSEGTIKVSLLAVVLSVAMPLETLAQSSAATAESLRLISDFADRICQTVPLDTTTDRLELSGTAKAELEGLVKTLASLGISGAAKYEATHSRNVLQKDLVEVLRDSRNCRLQIWNDLKGKFQIGAIATTRSTRISWRTGFASDEEETQFLFVSVYNTDAAAFEAMSIAVSLDRGLHPASLAAEFYEVISIDEVVRSSVPSATLGPRFLETPESITFEAIPGVRPGRLRPLDLDNLNTWRYTSFRRSISGRCRLSRTTGWEFELYCSDLAPGGNVRIALYAPSKGRRPRDLLRGTAMLRVGDYECESRFDELSKVSSTC